MNSGTSVSNDAAAPPRRPRDGRLGARALLAGGCLLLLKLTGCPTPAPRPDNRTLVPSSTGGGTPSTPSTPSTPTTPAEPPAPVSIAAVKQCPMNAAGRTCDVTQTDDGSAAPKAHPCQYPQIGQCDADGQPLCLFRWKLDGEPCNNGLGTCQDRRCRCTSDRSCGYDCTQTCAVGTSCQQGVCVSLGGADGGGGAGTTTACGGCAHRSC